MIKSNKPKLKNCVCMECLPNNKERVTIKMPALNDVFVVLEHKFDEGSVISTQDGGVKVQCPASRPVRDASHAENSSNFEVVRQLEGSVCRDKRHTIHSISLLAIHLTGRIFQHVSLGCVNQSIVVGTLWVWPGSTCCKIGPDRAGLVQRPVNLDGRSTGGWARDSASRVGVMKSAGGGEDRSGETRGSHNVVVLPGLISGY